ncbi:hypothetical protein RSAG8_07116, partial [Rhizoctonia solani AG-8 WAC10335]
MPAVVAPGKILVTGVNGFLGAYTARDLLERGFGVVGTVRSSAKGDEISKYFSLYGDRFSYALIQDMSQPGAFDGIISTGEFDGIAHTASPVPLGHNLISDGFNVATEGTLNLLRSIQDHGPMVKRVVITSSGLAATQLDPGIMLTEVHWNDESVKIVEEKGDAASDFERYTASKVLSERAAWNFVEDNRDKISFDLVTVLPAAILGAPMNENTTLDLLGASHLLFEGLRTARPESQLEETLLGFVHAKDVAALHSECFIQSRAAGHRVFAASADPSWQDIYNALNEEPAFPGIHEGKPGVGGRSDNESLEYDMTFAKSLLGRQLIGAKDMIRETARYYQGAGWEFVRS